MSSESTHRRRTFTGTERRRLGRYETLFRIAGGGMAEVYAARIVGEAGFEKVVALKRMLPTLAEDPRFVDMFLDEGRLAANISSPYVVQTLDLGRADDDSLYLVMELVVGVPLATLLREVIGRGEPMDTRVTVEIIAQAALGLHDAHEATTPTGEPLHLIHRDVSPQNIIVDRTGRARILDFGVARAMQRSSHTQTGEVKGKMAYFAPEQATSAALDRRVDIFALGVVAWEALAGRRLFKADNPLRTLQKITQEPIPTLLDVRPSLDPQLSAVVARALERDPDRRYPTAAEFAQALRRCLPARVPPAEVGAYVQAHGGQTLQMLERSLRLTLGDPGDGPRAASPAAAPDEPLPPDEHPDDAVSESRIVQITAAEEVAPQRGAPFRLLAGVGALTALAGLAFAWLAPPRGEPPPAGSTNRARAEANPPAPSVEAVDTDEAEAVAPTSNEAAAPTSNIDTAAQPTPGAAEGTPATRGARPTTRRSPRRPSGTPRRPGTTVRRPTPAESARPAPPAASAPTDAVRAQPSPPAQAPSPMSAPPRPRMNMRPTASMESPRSPATAPSTPRTSMVLRGLEDFDSH